MYNTKRSGVSGVLALAPVVLAFTPMLSAAPIIRSAAGPDAAAIQAEFDAFIADLGGANNGTTPGSQGSGFRRITWDGGGAAAPATTFASPMTAFSNRGNVYTTDGGSFEISGQPSPEFGDINTNYPSYFQPFSGTRLFAPLGSTEMDVLLTNPGTTNVPARTKGFGVVFSDVDLASTTALLFYDTADNLINTYYAPVYDGGLSFLGVTLDDAIVARVRIITGNAALSPLNNDGGGVDVVAMDDFVFGEPTAVPEPASLLLFGAGLTGLGLWRRYRRQN